MAKRVLEADRVINVPVLKTHLQTVVTGALKNLKGVVPGREKHIIHLAGLDDGIVDINTVVRTDLVVVDAIDCMEGTGGPTNGRPIRVGLIIAGDNPVEVDATCLRIMGVDPHKVAHVRKAAERGLGRLDGFEVLGERGVGGEAIRRALEPAGQPLLHQRHLRQDRQRRRQPPGQDAGKDAGHGGRFGRGEGTAQQCNACAVCVKACPVEAITMREKLPEVDKGKCILCFCCAEACPEGALEKVETKR